MVVQAEPLPMAGSSTEGERKSTYFAVDDIMYIRGTPDRELYAAAGFPPWVYHPEGNPADENNDRIRRRQIRRSEPTVDPVSDNSEAQNTGSDALPGGPHPGKSCNVEEIVGRLGRRERRKVDTKNLEQVCQSLDPPGEPHTGATVVEITDTEAELLGSSDDAPTTGAVEPDQDVGALETPRDTPTESPGLTLAIQYAQLLEGVDAVSSASDSTVLGSPSTLTTEYEEFECPICFSRCIERGAPPEIARLVLEGVRLPCEGNHGYCVYCFEQYLLKKIISGMPATRQARRPVVFPIPCPLCTWEISDEIAAQFLKGDTLGQWNYQKLLDTIDWKYCPNRKCSALLEIEACSKPVKENCPQCRTALCVSCVKVWHPNLTCQEYRAKEDKRRVMDDPLLKLVQARKMQQCPHCYHLVELSSGCNHMVCICLRQFCYRCGCPWKHGCTSDPPCTDWTEQALEARRMEVYVPPPPEKRRSLLARFARLWRSSR